MNVRRVSNEALEYTAHDCYSAVRANPRNPKCLEYLRQARECEHELERRARVRTLRYSLSKAPCDPLTLPLRSRRNWARAGWQVKLANGAMWILGYMHLDSGRE